MLKEGGTVWVWGLNMYGQLGIGSTEDKYRPVQLNISDVEILSPGSTHTFVIKTDGTLWAWGRNYRGELGDGTTTQRETPIQILSNVRQVFGRFNHTMVIKKDGTVWGWGNNEFRKLLGTETTENVLSPVPIPGL